MNVTQNFVTHNRLKNAYAAVPSEKVILCSEDTATEDTGTFK